MTSLQSSDGLNHHTDITMEISIIMSVNVNQSCYRPGGAQRVLGSYGSQIS